MIDSDATYRVRTIILDPTSGQEQVVDIEPISGSQWFATRGTSPSAEDTGSPAGTQYRIELLAAAGDDDTVIDAYEVTTHIEHIVRVNVYDGTIRVDLPGDDDPAAWDDLTGPDGGVFNGTTIEPWRVDEEDMDRADAALAEFGFERVGPWSDEEYPTTTIRRVR